MYTICSGTHVHFCMYLPFCWKKVNSEPGLYMQKYIKLKEAYSFIMSFNVCMYVQCGEETYDK